MRSLTLLSLAGTAAFAQLTTSTIRGHVSDPSGAAVSGARVELTNTGTGIQRDLTTNSGGDFEIPDLQRGTYRLSVSMSGFRNFVADNIILEASQIRRIDVPLEIGAVGTEVTVRANAAVITTDSSKIQGTFTKERFEDSPWIGDGRNPQVVMVTLPLVQSTSGIYGIQVAGLPASQVQTGIDGVNGDGSSLQTANVHIMQEVDIVVGNNSAEFARAGYINMSTKGGTNRFHGTAAYWHQNNALAARKFFEATKPSNLFHTYHLEASGPARRDKTFFYGAITGQSWPGSNFILRDVPTERMRRGDFSQLLGARINLRDPLNSNAPFAGNLIPASRLNSTAARVFERYLPAPNLGGPDALNNNYGFLFPYPVDLYTWRAYEGRVDHHISSNNTVFGRVILSRPLYVLAGNYPGLAWTRIRDSRNIAVEDTHIFSPTLVNTVRFGWYQPKVIDGETVDGFNPLKGDEAVKELGIQGVNPQGLSAMGFPRIDIAGYQPLRVNPGGINGNDILVTITDAVTWSKGSHTLKAGGEYRPQSNFNSLVAEASYGLFNFNGSLTGYGAADFFLGFPFSSQRLNPLTKRKQLDNELGLFVNDTWKASSRVTLDWGLRWDRFGSPNYDDGKVYNWDRETGNVVIPAGIEISPLYPRNTIRVVTGDARQNPSETNFQPRIGIAWRPGGSGFVVRGGYGIYTEQIGRFARAQGGGPYQLSETFFNNTQGQPLLGFPNPFPAGAGSIPSQSVSGFTANTENGRVHQFNITLERQVEDMGFRLTYQGSRSRGLNYNIETNKPPPSLTPFAQGRRPFSQFVGASFARNDGAANFNALTVQGQRKAGQLVFDVHWTLASNYWNYQNLENPYAPLFWERDTSTVRQRLVINAIWQVPVGKGKQFLPGVSGPVEQVIGGWQVYWVGFLETGQFFGASYTGSDRSNTNTVGGRPDRVANGNLAPGERTITRWFDTTAFALPPVGRFGNSGTNVLEGPGLNVHNLTIGKTFPISERVKFTFMAASQNIANHANFNNPASNISVPGSLGRISSTRGFAPGRQIMLRGRLQF
jgi:hypothetical protein